MAGTPEFGTKTGTFRRTISESIRSTGTRSSRRMFKHSVCEVCSSFYTSNPLMYISRYSEIIVTSGYDLETGTAASAGMYGKVALSSRRELVEQLDSEPLFDYLIQNGALEEAMVNELKSEKSAAKVNLALLKHVENSGKCAVNLFINALRQTGQHHLASLLDDSQRIKALSGSGYLSKNRHKGQVSLHVNVRAMRLPLSDLAVLRRSESTPRKTASFRSNLGNRDWVSLDEIHYRILELTEPTVIPPIPQFDIIDSPDEELKHKSCLCLCFAGMFSRKKTDRGSSRKNNGQKATNHKQNGYTSPSGVEGKYKATDVYPVTNGEVGESSEKVDAGKEVELQNLRNLEDTFRGKMKELYLTLSDQPGLIALLAKYFEQDRGILVLETNFDSGLVIVNICMKLEQLEQLRRDYSNGKLNKDVENCLLTDHVLQRVGVKGLKLHTDINQDEFEIAEQELTT